MMYTFFEEKIEYVTGVSIDWNAVFPKMLPITNTTVTRTKSHVKMYGYYVRTFVIVADV